MQGGHRKAQGAPGRQGSRARGASLWNPLQGILRVLREATVFGFIYVTRLSTDDVCMDSPCTSCECP